MPHTQHSTHDNTYNTYNTYSTYSTYSTYNTYNTHYQCLFSHLDRRGVGDGGQSPHLLQQYLKVVNMKVHATV